jgi:hypothetical protein
MPLRAAPVPRSAVLAGDRFDANWGENLLMRVGPLQTHPIPSQTLLCTISIHPGADLRAWKWHTWKRPICGPDWHHPPPQFPTFPGCQSAKPPHPELRRTSEFSNERAFVTSLPPAIPLAPVFIVAFTNASSLPALAPQRTHSRTHLLPSTAP